MHVFFLYAQPAVFLQVFLASPEHASPPPDEEQISSRSQQPVVPHGATRSLPELASQSWTPQRASGNVPANSLPLRYLRRRGAVARRAGVGGAGGTRSHSSAVSWPISVGIGPSILLSSSHLRRRRSVARRAGRRGRGGNSQVL